MSVVIIVALVAYASIVRPVLNDEALDVHAMWVWQVFATLLVIVPPWLPGWRELALTTCFAIGCVDPSVLRRHVRDVVFPYLRRHVRHEASNGDHVPAEEGE